MNRNPGITFATINWNHELLLPRAIQSALKAMAVLRSQGIDSEHIVLDYQSRDGSPTLLRNLEAIHYNDGLKVMAYKGNESLAAGRNKAVELAKFRYLCFLDSDNELIPENVPLFYQTLLDTSAAVAFGNLLIREQPSLIASRILNNESIQRKIYEANYIDAFVCLDTIQLHDAGLYDANLTLLEDWESLLHLITTGHKVVFVPIVLGYYYCTPGSMSKIDPARTEAGVQKNIRIFNQFDLRKTLPLKSDMYRYHPHVGQL